MRLRLALIAVLIGAGVALIPSTTVQARTVIPIRAANLTTAITDGARTLQLPFAAHHVAVHWRGNPDAVVTVNGIDVGRDEVGEQRDDGETYGAVQYVGDVSSLRLTADRALDNVTVVAMTDGVKKIVRERVSRKAFAADDVGQPGIISRAGWGADESKRSWAPSFAPIKRMIVHHTVTANDERDPASTVRSIYHYHAVSQGWGDIGYNFLVDHAGRIYEGRWSGSITGEDGGKRGVIGAHARGNNRGAVGTAMLGNLANRDASPQAKSALADLLAWKADRHNLDPQGLIGHRDVGETACPGSAFYAQLPAIRNDIAARIARARDRVPPTTPQGITARGWITEITVEWQPSTDEGGSGLAGYEVFRADRAEGPFTHIGSTASLSWVDAERPHLSTAFYNVRAFDHRGNRSPFSGVVSALAL